MGKSSSRKKQSGETPKGVVASTPDEFRYAVFSRTFASNVYFHFLIIAVVGAIAYSNTLHYPFVLDDKYQIMNNQMLRSLDNFWLALGGHNFGSSGYQYIPSRFVGYLSFALNYHFGGYEVRGYHLTNLAIHILNAFLVYYFLHLTFKTPLMLKGPLLSAPAPVALFAALLFVSHPIQTQAVTYIVQRFASLATLFYLLALVFYIKGRLAGQPGGKTDGSSMRVSSVLFFLVSLVSAVLAMKTKEISFTLPIVIILYEHVFFATPLRKKLLFLLPVVLTIVIVPLSVVHSGKPLGEILSDISETTRVQTELPRWDYLMTEMSVITTYIRLIFVPVNQNLDYDYPIYHSLLSPPVLFSFGLLLSIFCLGVYLLFSGKWKAVSPYRRLIGFGILWFFITLSVESSIIPIADVIFEHRVYLPLVGFLISITAGVFAAASWLRKERYVAIVFVLVSLALTGATYARNNTWKSGTDLWEDVVRKSSNKARPHDCLGVAYTREGRLDEAMREFQTALRINPGYVDSHTNLGVVYGQEGRLDEAMGEFQTALGLKPDYVEAHNNLGVVYRRQGRLADAMREFQAALKINPDYADAHNNLGVVYQQGGRLEDAMREFQTALRLNPDYVKARNNLEAISQLSSHGR